MADDSKGLPMASKWDPEKLQREVEQLKELNARPFFGRIGGYVKRSGPGLLQSAMTLGAGSAAASIMAGASFGYKLLWVQPLAMFLGIMMLAALGNIVLTTGERPYKAFGREFDVSIGGRAFGHQGRLTLAFFWALGTVMASIIWHFPQYGLAAGAAWDMATAFGAPAGAQNGVKFGIGGVILAISIITTWNYGGNSRGIKMYEWFLRTVIALVIVSFGIVVVCRFGDIEWTKLFRGFFGLDGIPNVEGSTTIVLGMLGAAVGINMTFLYPYSLLAKGWGKHHKGVQRADLAISMFLPFVLVTSLMMLAMTLTPEVYKGVDQVNKSMTPLKASSALSSVMNENLGRIIFDLGFVGMTCGAISTHMVVCGFTFCEMFGLEYTVWRYRLFSLVPAIGYFGVITQTPMWFPVAASAVCFTMLPIAYVIFLVLNNKRSYIGDAVGKGFGRFIFNCLLVVALTVATVGALIGLNKKVIKPIRDVIVQNYMSTSTPKELKALFKEEGTAKTTQEFVEKLGEGEKIAVEEKKKEEAQEAVEAKKAAEAKKAKEKEQAEE